MVTSTDDANPVEHRQRSSAASFLGQPIGLSTIFATDALERFSYYSARALLVLFLTAPLVDSGTKADGGPGMGLDKADAVAIYGAFTGLVYLTPLAGGWLADRIFGARLTVLAGTLTIAVGYVLMATGQVHSFALGLVVLAVGIGLFKGNIAAMVGMLYSPTDTRRDSGYTYFYMSVNLGSFTGPLIGGWVAVQHGWRAGFLVSAVAMVVTIGVYLVGRRLLAGVGGRPKTPASRKDRASFGGVVVGAVAFALALSALWSVSNGRSVLFNVANSIPLLIVAVAVIYFVFLFRNPVLTVRERKHLRAFLLIFIAAVAFWLVEEQAGSTLNLFAQNVTDRGIGSWVMPSEWLQSVNPLLSVVFAPVFAWLWTRMADRAPNLPLKFAIALVGVGLSFWLLVIPMAAYDTNGTKAAISWLFTVYLLQTWAEILLSPTGLSASTRLAPAGKAASMVALWYLGLSLGSTLGGQVARFTIDAGVRTFWVSGAIAIVFGIAMFLLRRVVQRLMDG